VNELSLANPLSRRVVEQDRISIGFPNRRQFDAARAVEAKEYAARPFAANQDSFRYLKRSRLKFMLIAKGLMDKSAQVIQVVKLEGLFQHGKRGLLADG